MIIFYLVKETVKYSVLSENDNYLSILVIATYSLYLSEPSSFPLFILLQVVVLQ